MTQPEGMNTSDYVCGVERLIGNDAWAMFKACAMEGPSRLSVDLHRFGRHVVRVKL